MHSLILTHSENTAINCGACIIIRENTVHEYLLIQIFQIVTADSMIIIISNVFKVASMFLNYCPNSAFCLPKSTESGFHTITITMAKCEITNTYQDC